MKITISGTMTTDQFDDVVNLVDYYHSKNGKEQIKKEKGKSKGKLHTNMLECEYTLTEEEMKIQIIEEIETPYF